MLLQVESKTVAQKQLEEYNQGNLVRNTSYSPPAGSNWAVVGLVLDDSVLETDEAAIVAAATALTAIDLVADPRFYGQAPTVIEIGATHEFNLHCRSDLYCLAGTVNNRINLTETRNSHVAIPLGKKWIVMNCLIPLMITTQALVDTVQTQLQTIPKILASKVLLFGQIPLFAERVQLNIETRLRIDEVEA